MSQRVSRRRLLADSALALAACSVAGGESQAAAEAPDSSTPFRSRWDNSPDRAWLGAEYWANPLQDWRVTGGRIECLAAQLNRQVHLLTRQLAARTGKFEMSVRLGRLEGGEVSGGPGSAGFRLGIQGPLGDYRNALLYGQGLDAGLTGGGALFIGDVQTAKSGQFAFNAAAVELKLTCEPTADGHTLTLVASDPATNKELGRVTKAGVPAARLVGNVALIANYGTPPRPAARARQNAPAASNAGAAKFWFADWHMSGDKFDAHEGQAFGPILFSQYTLSEKILKLTAQMPPLGPHDAPQVQLQVDRGDGWQKLAEAPIHPEARTATFKIEKWDDTRDAPYRLAYALKSKDGAEQVHYWQGVVRRDPVDRPVLTVADISCNIHAAFPNADYVRHMASLDPHLLAFTGDQFYESSGGYGITVTPLDAAMLDYLRKWYLHGWTWRDLMRDRPSVSIPDDHDVYQGNLWGENGGGPGRTQEQGGYRLPGAWVNVVHRTQTSHHPDPFDPTPAQQGITPYYGPLTYGRVSFAILADRMYKTGPEGTVPPTGGRGDHVTDPNFDPKTADVAGAELLGAGQMKFLRVWAADWKGADLKAVISQTIFTAMATTHGGERMRLVADYDTNAWPQTARNAALTEMRKAFAFHIAGDQHLPALVHYGIEGPRDAGLAFAGPAVNVGYPRWWEPAQPGKNRRDGAPEITGDFTDHFGHPLTVIAVANGAVKPRAGVLEAMQDKVSGLGLVRFDKARRKITIECWPYLADPKDPQAKQFPGWPVEIDQMENFGRKAAAHLPKLHFAGGERPVVQVIDERDGQVVYTLRVAGDFQPPVFAVGSYTLRVSDPESGRLRELPGIAAVPDNAATLTVIV